MRVKVNSLPDGLTITPIKKHGRARYVGTVILSNVVIRDGEFTGELMGEYLESYTLESSNLPQSIKDKMKPVNVAVMSAKALYATTDKILYLP